MESKEKHISVLSDCGNGISSTVLYNMNSNPAYMVQQTYKEFKNPIFGFCTLKENTNFVVFGDRKTVSYIQKSNKFDRSYGTGLELLKPKKIHFLKCLRNQIGAQILIENEKGEFKLVYFRFFYPTLNSAIDKIMDIIDLDGYTSLNSFSTVAYN